MPLPRGRSVTDPAPIPLIDLQAQYSALKPILDEQVLDTLSAARFILGPQVAELEERLAQHTGARHVVTCANGTDALKLPLLEAGIGPGDAVFVPSFTFVATAEVVAGVGADPVFVDIDPSTFGMDPAHLEHVLGEVAEAGRLAPRAVIPVDMFGLPADYDAVNRVAAEHELIVIGDAAQSFGAELGGHRVGTLAPVTTTSFYPSKPLSCYGDGGCIFVEDESKAVSIRQIARHGFGTDGFSAIHVGLNSRLDTLQAVVLLAKLRLFEGELEARRCVAAWYEERLADVVATPSVPEDRTSVWAVYSVRTERRDEVREALKAERIGSAAYYVKPIHVQPAYAPYSAGPGSLPVTERVCRETLALPMHPYLQEEAVDRVARVVRGVLV
jgi:UDP-2-acetamido-2-deoxy-ribo-hexuluronate aminotransferase